MASALPTTHTGGATVAQDAPHAREHDPELGHHFESLEQQHDANVLGMWTFLITELMLFGGMFLAYLLFRMLYPGVFFEGAKHQNVLLGAINTAVLITSSLTMALAVHAAQVKEQRKLQLFLLATALLGAVFLGIKGVEYYDHYIEGLVPGALFTNAEVLGNVGVQGALYFFIYFVMTGIHAIHMIIGIGIVLTLLVRSRTGRYLGNSFVPVEMMGLYWHFVDVIWVFLFPLLYLLGKHAPDAEGAIHLVRLFG